MCRLFLLIFVIIIVVVSNDGSLSLNEIARTANEPAVLRVPTIDWNAPLCTFPELVKAFGDKDAQDKLLLDQPIQHHHDRSLEAHTCWSLEQLMLRVPAAAILNRDQLVKLGNGRKGVVHKVVVALTSPETEMMQQCIAAVKSDCCYAPEYHFANPQNDKDGTAMCSSCISTGSNVLVRAKSFLRGEYTGALPWYAQVLSKHDPFPGLLPTWALITDETRPLRHRFVPHKLLGGSPHPDASVLGVLMPIRPFQSLDETAVPLPDNETDGVTSFARTFLPAAEGLQFVSEQLGLAFQDIAEKNIGIYNRNNGKTEPTAFVYDNGYVGLDHGTWHDEGKLTLRSKFCQERSFAIANRKKNWAGTGTSSSLDSDFFHFRLILASQWKQMLHAKNVLSEENRQVTQRIQSAPSIQQLVAVLKSLSITRSH